MRLFFLVLMGLAISGFVVQSYGSELGFESDSGVPNPPYEKIERELIDLQSHFPALARRVIYGRTVEGRNLNLIRIGLNIPPASRVLVGKAVVISGATHGDEYLNIEDRLPRWFLENGSRLPGLTRFINEGGVVYIVPVLNPDGFSARRRLNHNHQDLNRDFPINWKAIKGFTQLETKLLADYLDGDLTQNRLQLKLSVDYHCCIGALLFPWSFKAPPIPAQDLAAFRAIGAGMQNIFGTSYQFGTTPVLLGYEAFGTTKDYYYERYKSLSFTFEGQFKVEPQNFDRHAQFWEANFSALNARR